MNDDKVVVGGVEAVEILECCWQTQQIILAQLQAALVGTVAGVPWKQIAGVVELDVAAEKISAWSMIEKRDQPLGAPAVRFCVVDKKAAGEQEVTAENHSGPIVVEYNAPDAAAVSSAWRNIPHWALIERAPMMDKIWPIAQSPGIARGAVLDARIALTLRHHGVTAFATRNPADCQGFGFTQLISLIRQRRSGRPGRLNCD